MHSLLVAYGIEDSEIARSISRALLGRGFEVWLADNSLRDGAPFPKSFDDALQACGRVLLIWSASSPGYSWLEREWTTAAVAGRDIAIYRVDNTPVPQPLRACVQLSHTHALREARAPFEALASWLETGTDKALGVDAVDDDPRALPMETSLIEIPGMSTLAEPVSLRSRPSSCLGAGAVERMLAEHDFFDALWRPLGSGLPGRLQRFRCEAEDVVCDHATGLLWQQAGSESLMKHAEAGGWIAALNARAAGGFSDWRLPTLEEALSLLRPSKNRSQLHIARCFSSAQRYIWTGDRLAQSVVWYVSFPDGALGNCRGDSFNYVRAVRSTATRAEHTSRLGGFSFFKRKLRRRLRTIRDSAAAVRT